MSQSPRPSHASRFTIPFEIPAYWTPEQALAVVELLDDLRTLIWAHYDIRLSSCSGRNVSASRSTSIPRQAPKSRSLTAGGSSQPPN